MSYSENTVKRYTVVLNKLEEAGFTDFDKDAENIVKYILLKYDNINTRKSCLTAIFSTYADKTNIPKVFRDALNPEFKIQKQEGLAPEQMANYLPWKKILKVQSRLKSIENKTNLEWFEYIVVSLYTLISPVHAEYSEMLVKKHYRDAKRTAKKNVFVQIEKPYFVFTDYKTYEKVKISVPKPLVEVITQWFEYLGYVPEYLLGNKYNPVVLSNFIRDTFMKYTDKNIGITLLKYSYQNPTLKTPV